MLLRMSENELRKQQVSGFYRDIELGQPPVTSNQVRRKRKKLEGI